MNGKIRLLVAFTCCAIGCGSGGPQAIARIGQDRPTEVNCPRSTDGDQCLTDQDCGMSGVCSCDGSSTGWAGRSIGNVCVPSNCRDDADCGPLHACVASASFDAGPFYGVGGYFCTTLGDTCATDADCPAMANMPRGFCAWDSTVAHWACSYSFVAG